MNEIAVRKKRWYRLRNLILGALALIVVLLGWAFIEVWRVYTGEPKITRDYRAEFRRMSEKAAGVPEGSGDAAWAILMDAATRCEDVIFECEAPYRTGKIPARTVPGQGLLDSTIIDFGLVRKGQTLPSNIQPEIDGITALRREGVFARLAEFAKQGVGFRTVDNAVSMFGEQRPEWKNSRTLAKARAASMRLAMEENDAEEVCSAFDELLAMSRTISHQAPLISLLIGMAINAFAFSEMQNLLMEHEFDEASCRRLLRSIAAHPLATVAIAIEGERAFFHDFAQRCYTDDGTGDGYAIGIEDSLRSRTLLGAAQGRFLLATRKQTLDKYNEYIDGMIKESQLLASERWVTFNPSPDFKSWGYRHAMLAIMLPALQNAVDATTTNLQKRDATRIMIALELFYALHKRWPNSLDELTPSILLQAPRDPLHDGPFGYRLLENDPHHRPYLLYSFGRDGQDDGGKVTENELEDYRRGKNPLQRGFDDVMNVPRSPSQLEARPRDETSDLEGADDGEIEAGTKKET